MNPVHIILVETLNSLVLKYNNKEKGINYVDLRNLENYITSQGIDKLKVNQFLNKQK